MDRLFLALIVTQHLFSIDMLSVEDVEEETEENEKREEDLKMEQNRI